MRKVPLEEVLDRRSLRRLAGARSFERGEDYFLSGTVKRLAVERGRLTARVTGSREYEVTLWTEDGGLGGSCTCPMGADGAFCKHCVAVGLAWLESREGGSAPVRRGPTGAESQPPAEVDLRGHLRRLDKERLVEMLLEQAGENERLDRRLHLDAAMSSRQGIDVAAFRAAIDDAVQVDDHVSYREVYDYAKGVDDVVDSIEHLVKGGHSAEAVDLIEHALDEVEVAIGWVDDSGGSVGMILDRLVRMHLAACKKARPDPVALAKRLLARELGSEHADFGHAAKKYASVLGQEGIAVYRKLAEQEWSRLPALGPGSEDRARFGRRGRLADIMEGLVGGRRDVEPLVAIKRQDLSHPGAYLAIAETYRRAKKHDRALEWAERGLKDFPNRRDPGLHDFVVAEYHRRKRHGEAIALEWKEFTTSPGLHGYQKLRASADRAGEWPAWRQKALAFLREDIERARKLAGRNPWAGGEHADHSRLVRIFLWEKDVEAAWNAAQAGGCSSGLWLDLAGERGRTHPADAIPIYDREVDQTLRRTGGDAYRAAIALLRKVCALQARIGGEDDFAKRLDRLRAEHKRKRNFVELLSRARWN